MLIRLSICLAALASLAGPAAAEPFPVSLQRRDPITGEVQIRTVELDPSKVGVVVVDMWNWHWCKTSTARVAALVPRMNRVVHAAREMGMTIFWCPSDVADNYIGTPPYEAAFNVERMALPERGELECPPAPDGGGCTCGGERCRGNYGWDGMHPDLVMDDRDFMPNDLETLYTLCRQRGLTHVIYLGVHTQVCLLGKSIGLSNMSQVGFQCILARDLTDAHGKYDPVASITPDTFTAEVVAHFEKYLAPTINFADELRGAGRWDAGWVVDPVRITPWGTSTRPHLFDAEVVVTLTAPWQPRAAIHYTLDGSEPTSQSPRYSEPLRLRATTRLRASALEAEKPVCLPSEALFVRLDTPPPPPDVALGELAPLRVVGPGHSPASNDHRFSPVSAPPQQNRSNRGQPLRLRGIEYDRGLGVHAPNQLVYALRPEYDRFVALAGVDDHLLDVSHGSNLAMKPSVVLKVFIDGHLAAASPVLRISEPLWHFNVAIPAGAKRISLVTTDAGDGNREDLVNWVAAGFVTHRTHENAAPRPDDSAAGWRPLRVPGTWEDNSQGQLQHDGFAWYRCLVRIPEAWRGKEVDWRIEQIDNSCEAFVNGLKVGSLGRMPPDYVNGHGTHGEFDLRRTDLRYGGDNVFALRFYDEGGRGGFKGAAPVVVCGPEAITLDGQWQFFAGDDPGGALPSKPGELVDVFQEVGRTPAPPPPPLDLPQEAPAGSQPLAPAEAVRQMHVAADLELEQVLAEPLIAQPVFLNFDERGRMWVVEYRQYPWPAGLKLVSRDSVWRNVYDQVPPPPPHHFRGADRISIHEDTDGDGTFDQHKVFLDGLNIVTAVERGRGGVWVLNPPYLLFYPDANRDDVPDGDPVVHLAGFGLEDTHSVANSLRWGPDGWLYGAQGSTVTANIVRPGLDDKPLVRTVGQQIWRYHPESRRFEVFSEGGGNAFGCEMDSQGRIFSGHNGGDTRGFHYAQGAYLQKGFEKHGPLSNPYAFGYFPPMPHHRVPRFTHNFIIYDGGALPPHYQGKLFGVEPIQGRIVLSEMTPDQSSFRTRDLEHVVTSDDRWFRPVDIKVGPDGAVYICDWYDQQVNHYRNHEGRMDATHGRVYRLRSRNASRVTPFDLAALSTQQLVETLAHSNKWYRQTALRLLADRRDPTAIPILAEQLAAGRGQVALESLWGWYLSGGWNETMALRCLQHADEFVRQWTVRLAGDARSVSPAVRDALIVLARQETRLETRNQLAASALRLPAEDGLAVVRELLQHDEDADDNRMPLLLWWALEAHCAAEREQVVALFEDPGLWSRPLVERHLLERVMRRFAQAGSRADLLACARLLDLSPTPEHRGRLMAGFEAAFQGRTLAGLPDELVRAMRQHGVGSVALGLRQGDAKALRQALQAVADEQVAVEQRLEYLQVLSELKVPEAVPVVLKVLEQTPNDALRRAALAALQPYGDAQIGERVVVLYPQFSADVAAAAQNVLASRAAWALTLVRAIESGTISGADLPLALIRKCKQHHDAELVARAEKLWPDTGVPTSAEMNAKIRRWATVVEGDVGDPYNGRRLFQKSCGACHQLFGQGGAVGPDLTSHPRGDVATMLLHVVNPSAEIREGYENYSVETQDGRLLTGLVVDRDNRTVVLLALDGQRLTLAQDDIAEMKVNRESLMPSGQLDTWRDEEVRDLFAYLRSSQPLVGESPPNLRDRVSPRR